MNKINEIFKKGPAFIAYITAGQKSLDHSFKNALSLIKGGVDILEIGIPFSDPIADGPIIQKAMVTALKNKTTIKDVLELTTKIKKETSTPIILFGYYNTILQQKDFYKKARDVGADGILIVDLPLEEAKEHIKNCRKFKIDPIFVVTPSTDKNRVKKINKYAKGFIYYACRKGTTGIKNDLPENFKEKIKEIKSISKLPVVAGFGIASRKIANKIIKHADGFVVGSLFVDAIEKNIPLPSLRGVERSVRTKQSKTKNKQKKVKT